MRIPLKANLILLLIATIVIQVFGLVSTPFLENIVRMEVLQKARIMMEAAAGIRAYTSNEIAPLVKSTLDGDKFHPQTVPAYAANKNFALLARKFVDYSYREAALNPINPLNRAADWEADIIADFRRRPHKLELITERETHNGRVLNLSHPIVSNGPCLTCHGNVDKAPKAMIAAYGTQSGFGWKINEVVGAQIVSVPMAVALNHSARIRNMFVGVLAGVFLLLIALLNALPIVMRTLVRTDRRSGEVVRTRAAVAQPMRAFGYGLIAAGAAVVVIAHAVVYAREGIAGLEKALDPFVLGNYVSVAAVVPGVLTLLLAGYLNGRRPSGAPYPTAQPILRSEETSLWDDTSLRDTKAGR